MLFFHRNIQQKKKFCWQRDLYSKTLKLLTYAKSTLIFNMVVATIVESGFEANSLNYRLFHILLLWII